MKICRWFPGGGGDFGDDLNEWLWPRIAPDLLDENETEVLVGIGTLLNDLLPERLPATCRRIIVFSSGVGYETSPPRRDRRWGIYCVRGPLSAKALGVPDTLTITDGAALLHRMYKASAKKIHGFSYMPHATHARAAAGAWAQLCNEIGIGYVDPRWPAETVLAAIASTDVLLTEEMHAAIAADTMRIPWTELEIIVINDGSPAPARDDLKDLDFRRRQLGNLGLEAFKNASCCHTTEQYLRNSISIISTC